MRHRAPDGVATKSRNGFTMGMGRLAIVDHTRTNLAPLVSKDAVLSFNGEIYNWREIRKKLPYAWETQSDTETLLRAIQYWKFPEVFDHLNGMFAFACLVGDKVYFARDLAGEKPLYFIREPFYFASEKKALPGEAEEVPPGYWGEYNLKTKLLYLHQWWQPAQRSWDSYEEAKQELATTLVDAVRIRTQAEVPVGLYYSGGIDSHLIRTIADPIRTYSFVDSETYKEDFLALMPNIVWHLDGPVSSFSAYGLYKLGEMAAKDGRKVVISGEGADELFGGYVRYQHYWKNYQLQKEHPAYARLFPAVDPGKEEFYGNMQELLRMGDRMAAAHGIENRCPFLDRRIVEIAWSLPPEWKYEEFHGKRILRDILREWDASYQFQEKHGLYVSANAYLGVHDPFDKREYLRYQQQLWKTSASSLPTGRRTRSDLRSCSSLSRA